ncbi:MAG: elongation factor P hydroxylase [Idiomarina sp.]|nr:elongation factor P hydroxylase [Idiomarina sp.]
MQQSQFHQVKHVITVFNQCFAESMNTRLVLGEGEPLYIPASNRCSFHRVVFAHGFYRSALHEIAHWCVAGKVRRQLVDYGYWYKPDGRNATEQKAFEQVERKPQALEWLFCLAAGHSFEVSCDNLGASEPETIDGAAFARQVEAQLECYLRANVPPRAAIFAKALASFYGHRDPLGSVDQLCRADSTLPEFA